MLRVKQVEFSKLVTRCVSAHPLLWMILPKTKDMLARHTGSSSLLYSSFREWKACPPIRHWQVLHQWVPAPALPLLTPARFDIVALLATVSIILVSVKDTGRYYTEVEANACDWGCIFNCKMATYTSMKSVHLSIIELQEVPVLYTRGRLYC